MWKLVGILCALGGAAGFLYSWIWEEKAKQKRLEGSIYFLEKTKYMMQKERIKIADWFGRYQRLELNSTIKDHPVLCRSLEKMMDKLSTNTYPSGQMVWEEVLKEEEQNWNLDREVFQILVQAGNGLFGQNRVENINFLEKSIRELEQQQTRLKEKNIQQQKVWIPVGMLGTAMLVILFL